MDEGGGLSQSSSSTTTTSSSSSSNTQESTMVADSINSIIYDHHHQQQQQQQAPDQDEKAGGAIMSTHNSRRPNISSLQIPARTLENPLPSFTRINISSLPSPSSTRSGLPPRPTSTRSKSNVKNLLPQRSLKSKSSSTTEGDRTGLLIPGTPSSEDQQDKLSTSKPFSLTKVLSSISAKRTNSLPSTPIADLAAASAQERHVIDLTTSDGLARCTGSGHASTMVIKSYIWAYASFQFAIVILFAHIFYNVLKVSPVLSVLLSSFTGFGIAISTNSLLVEYLRWRTRREMQLAEGNQESRNNPESVNINVVLQQAVGGQSQNTSVSQDG